MNRVMPIAPITPVMPFMPRLLRLPSISESEMDGDGDEPAAPQAAVLESEASVDAGTPAAPQVAVLFRDATSDIECCVCLSKESELAPGHSVKLVGR